MTQAENMRAQASDRVDVLTGMLTLLEPETLDDVLTLVVRFRDEADHLAEVFADYVAMPVCGDVPPRADADYRPRKVQERLVDHLGSAVLRGPTKFAASPLIDDGHDWSVY